MADTSTSLGNFLKASRQAKQLSLRDVERKTKISNPYLSQLESGKIQNPAPKVLYDLAQLYEISYVDLMRLADYPVPKGRFIKSCENLLKDKSFALPWVDRFARESGITTDNEKLETITQALADVDLATANQLTTKVENFFDAEAFVAQTLTAAKKVKSKYTCNECKLNVWGRPNLQLRCDDCNLVLIER